MRARVSSFIATSLDGYIARPDGSIDWLTAVQTLIPAGEDCGYLDFMSSIDCLVMGRHTFEQASGYDEWPYADLPVVVLSRAPVVIPSALAESVRCEPGVAAGTRRAADRRAIPAPLRRWRPHDPELPQGRAAGCHHDHADSAVAGRRPPAVRRVAARREAGPDRYAGLRVRLRAGDVPDRVDRLTRNG